MRTVPLDEAQKTLPEWMEQAGGGEDVVIARGDGASCQLVPVVGHAPRRGGAWKGLVTVPDDFDAPLPDVEPYS